MNGRVYDYNLGKFMSVDPFIQDVGNSQGINPYSYLMNNPLMGTDPTGYTIEIKITACDLNPSNCGNGNNSLSDNKTAASAASSSQGERGSESSEAGPSTNRSSRRSTSPASGDSVRATTNATSTLHSISSGSANSSGPTSKPADQVGKPNGSNGSENVGQANGVSSIQTVHKKPVDSISIGDVNDNFITPVGLLAGYVERKTNESKRRWSDRYRNHGKIWNGAKLVGNYAFVAGSLITAGTTVSEIVNMRNSGRSAEDQVLRGIDGVVDIGFGVAAFFGPVGWLAAATYYGADYLSGGNLTQFMYRGITRRREEDVSSNRQ